MHFKKAFLCLSKALHLRRCRLASPPSPLGLFSLLPQELFDRIVMLVLFDEPHSHLICGASLLQDIERYGVDNVFSGRVGAEFNLLDPTTAPVSQRSGIFNLYTINETFRRFIPITFFSLVTWQFRYNGHYLPQSTLSRFVGRIEKSLPHALVYVKQFELDFVKDLWRARRGGFKPGLTTVLEEVFPNLQYLRIRGRFLNLVESPEQLKNEHKAGFDDMLEDLWRLRVPHVEIIGLKNEQLTQDVVRQVARNHRLKLKERN